MPGKRTIFNPKWKTDPNYESWLAADPKLDFNFICVKCQCTCELGNMGKCALNKHLKAKKHRAVDETRQSKSAGLILSWTRSSSTSSEANTVSSPMRL